MSHIDYIPSYMGIYIIQATNYNENELSLNSLRLIFIGASNNIKASITNRSNLTFWRSELKSNEQLLFSSVPILDVNTLLRLKEVLVYCNNPILNNITNYNKSYSPTSIKNIGMYFGLKEFVSV